MPDSQQKTIVIRRSTDIARLDELEQALLTGEAPIEVERDPEEVNREIIAALLEAQTDEQLERVEAQGWGEHVGVPFEIFDFVWRPSNYDEGQAVFLVVRAISMVDGDQYVLTTGSGQVMAQLANLAKRGRLPVIRELASAETKTKGRHVYWLRTPEAVKAAAKAEAAAATGDQAS